MPDIHSILVISVGLVSTAATIGGGLMAIELADYPYDNEQDRKDWKTSKKLGLGGLAGLALAAGISQIEIVERPAPLVPSISSNQSQPQ